MRHGRAACHVPGGRPGGLQDWRRRQFAHVVLVPGSASDNHYCYYQSANGVSRAIAEDYWNGNGLIFGEHIATRGEKTIEFGFFVGTEEEYRKIMPDRVSIL